MIDLFLILVLVAVGIIVVACACFFQVRRACCWFQRVQIDATWAQIQGAINEYDLAEIQQQNEEQTFDLKWQGSTTSSEDTERSIDRSRTSVELTQRPPLGIARSKTVFRSSLKKIGSQVVDVATNKVKVFLKDKDGRPVRNEELKKDDVGYYIERKWQIRQRTCCANWVARAWNNVLNSSGTWWVLTFVVIGAVASYSDKINASFRDAISVYILAFVGLFSVLISLLFSNGIEKNKENKRLFDALCGDVKGMAMWVSGLLNERKIYKFYPEIKEEDFITKIDRIDTKESYEVECAKIRLLLSVLAPVAKHVLRDSEKNRADYDMLDDKYRIRVYYKDERSSFLGINKCYSWLMGCSKYGQRLEGWFPPRVVKDTTQTWAKMGGKTDKKNDDNDGIDRETVMNPIKFYLYQKIKMVQDKSGMDLFEVIMYVLLDTINGLKEQKFIEAYGKERDLITKWQHIYGSWGTMASLTTYSQPFYVHLTIVFSLLMYMVGITMLNKHEAITKFKEIDGSACCGSEDWVDESRDEFYMWFYVFIKSFVQIFPFTWFWFLSKLIGKPFKKGYPDADIISKAARDTQYQVSNLMTNRAEIDGWDKGYDQSSLKKACDRESINCGTIYIDQTIKQSKQREYQIKKDVIKEYNRKDKNRRRSVKFGLGLEEKGSDGEDNGGRRAVVAIDLPDTGVEQRVLRYKNVNF